MRSNAKTMNDDTAYVVITREEVTDSTERRAYEMTGHGEFYMYSISLDDEMNIEYASPGHISNIVMTPNAGT